MRLKTVSLSHKKTKFIMINFTMWPDLMKEKLFETSSFQILLMSVLHYQGRLEDLKLNLKFVQYQIPASLPSPSYHSKPPRPVKQPGKHHTILNDNTTHVSIIAISIEQSVHKSYRQSKILHEHTLQYASLTHVRFKVSSSKATNEAKSKWTHLTCSH